MATRASFRKRSDMLSLLMEGNGVTRTASLLRMSKHTVCRHIQDVGEASDFLRKKHSLAESVSHSYMGIFSKSRVAIATSFLVHSCFCVEASQGKSFSEIEGLSSRRWSSDDLILFTDSFLEEKEEAKFSGAFNGYKWFPKKRRTDYKREQAPHLGPDVEYPFYSVEIPLLVNFRHQFSSMDENVTEDSISMHNKIPASRSSSLQWMHNLSDDVFEIANKVMAGETVSDHDMLLLRREAIPLL